MGDVFNYIETDQDGVVTGISQLTSEVNKENLYKVDTYDPGCVGKIYDPESKTFSDPEIEESAQDEEIDPEAMTETEFRAFVLEKLGYEIKNNK